MLKKPNIEEIEGGDESPAAEAHRGKRDVRFGDQSHATDTWDRTQLIAGNRIAGPALIEEHASTTVIHPGDTATVDMLGNLVVSVEGVAS